MELTRRITDMIGDLLDVSRIEAGRMPIRKQPIDLVLLIHDTLKSMRTDAVRVGFTPGVSAAAITGDPKVLGRVITNLVDNAVKFSAPGDAVTVRVDQGGDGIEVSVEDLGPGIPPEARETIFEKFGQVSGVEQPLRSSGLGLTFCKLAIEAHGGSIGVDGEIGQGSRFWFVVPSRTT
jgi:signal transduction histidine kinase